MAGLIITTLLDNLTKIYLGGTDQYTKLEYLLNLIPSLADTNLNLPFFYSLI